jgi:hypothetical protein
MTCRSHTFTAVSVIALLLTQPAIAADEPAPKDPAIAAAEQRQKVAEAQKAEADAKKAQYEAEQAAAKAQFGFLPQSPATGEVTTDAEAGKLEAAMLGSAAIRHAAAALADHAAGNADPAKAECPDDGTVWILVASDEAVDATLLSAFFIETQALSNSYTSLGFPPTTKAATPSNQPFTEATSAAAAIGAAVSGIAGLLKTDIDIKGISHMSTPAQLVRAVASRCPGRTVAKSALLMPSTEAVGPVTDQLATLDAQRNAARAWVAVFPQKPSAAALAKKAEVDAVLARHGELLEALTKAGEDGRTRLADVMIQHAMFAPVGKDAKLMRLHIDGSGGTLIKRQNFWTLMGAKALTMTSGIAASYTLSDFKTGTLDRAGTVVCGTNMKDFRAIHDGGIPDVTCWGMD